MLNICQLAPDGSAPSCCRCRAAQGGHAALCRGRHAAAAESLADRYGATVSDTETALADTEVDAVTIASSTETHADLIETSAKAGKAISCEKPINLDINRVNACWRPSSAAMFPWPSNSTAGSIPPFEPSRRRWGRADRQAGDGCDYQS